MAFSQQDRIEISKKLVSLPKENEGIQGTIGELQAVEGDAERLDITNSGLIDRFTPLVNAYQDEARFLDGNVRTVLTEQIMVDSAQKVRGNSFFPNDTDNPAPSVPNGVWVKFNVYANTHAVGRNAVEQFPSQITTESQIINNIDAQIDIAEGEILSNRITGKKCDNDDFEDNQVIIDALDEIKSLVIQWTDYLEEQKNAILAADEPDVDKQNENDIAINEIDSALSAISDWEMIQDFDTTTPLPSTCAVFNAMTEGDFQQAKLSPTTLQILKDAMSARNTFIPVRLSQLNNNLGSIVQDLDTGEYTSLSGLYGQRILYINLRLNLVTGSLPALLSIQNGISANNQMLDANEQAFVAYSNFMVAALLASPGVNLQYITIKDSSNFSVGDVIFLVADKQQELRGSITEIDGNRIRLNFTVPKKYTPANFGRLYRMIQ